jgi:hypothetical protein
MAQHLSGPDRALARLGLIKLGELDLDGIGRHVSQLAAETLPGAAEVSITVVDGRRPSTVAFTGEVALFLDELQYQNQLGPCLQAATERARRTARWIYRPSRMATRTDQVW